MAVNNDYMLKAQQAKRIERLFRDADVKIPIEVNGRTVEVHSNDISESCRQAKMENLAKFIQSMTTDEIIYNAGRINQVLYNRLTKKDRERIAKHRAEQEME